MTKLPRHISPLHTLFRTGTRVEYAKGETIIRPEDTPQGVFLIEKGFVKSYDITKYGEENLLVIRGVNQMFPLLWSMTDERTDVYYQAMSDVSLLRIHREVYLEKIDKDPEFTRGVLEQVLKMYHVHSQRVLNLEYRTAPERIAFRLLVLADRFGAKSAHGIEIAAPVRHQDIAESVNCSRETASRVIAKLQKRGLVGSFDGSLVLLNPEGLMDIIGVQETMRQRFNRFK